MSNDEILREFLLETHENLSLLDSDLVRLETHPTESTTLAQVFRTLHSIKGTAGFMGLVKLESVAHSAESLLSRLRAGELTFNRPIAEALLRVVDSIKEIIAQVETVGTEGNGDYAAVAKELDRLRESPGLSAAEPKGVGELPHDEFALRTGVMAESSWSQTVELPTELAAALKFKKDALPTASDSEVSFVVPQTTGPVEQREPKTGGVSESTIRVDVGLLDRLMTQVGELVLARNQILQARTGRETDALQGAVQRLNQLTSDLQASVMKTRMQPVSAVLGKFPRIVRDLAAACGKQVRLELEGQETELDKSLLEAIRDPLTHLVRNAVDHGIESPAVRLAHGKSAEGHLRILAFHEGGKVVIEIIDDGSGINVERVREKAIANRLITAETADRMSQKELMQLIFLPGFSTADRVTQFSGRGVGMDVVRTNIERIGGAVELKSALGRGTTIRTTIPLTLAIIPALIVECVSERYLIPQVSLLELVQLPSDRETRGIEWVQGVPVYRLRDNLLPLVFLDQQLKLRSIKSSEPLSIVVLQVEQTSFGLVVDAIRDTEEIVVKPLQQQLASVPVFAGASILGDGRVALVLDVLGLAQQAGVISGAGRQLFDAGENQEVVREEELPPVLLFLSAKGEQMAIPLADVARIEEFKLSDFERVGRRTVAQYRGSILPIIDVAAELDRLPAHEGEKVSHGSSWTQREVIDLPSAVGGEFPESGRATVVVIVCEMDSQQFGMIAGRVLDIVHQRPVGIAVSSRQGVLFTAILHDRVTEFIDLATLVPAALGVPAGEATHGG